MYGQQTSLLARVQGKAGPIARRLVVGRLAIGPILNNEADNEAETLSMRAFTAATRKLLKRVAPLFSDDILSLDCTDDCTHLIAVCYREYIDNVLFERDANGDNIATIKKTWPSKGATEWCKNVPERQEVKGYNYPAWKVAATDISAQIINSVWAEHEVRFESDKARLLYNSLLLNWEVQEILAENVAKYKADKTIPESAQHIEISAGLPLVGYQLVGAANILLSEAYALFFKPGCGKTAPVISVICNLAKHFHAEHGKPLKALIVPPKGVKQNWYNEFCRFATQAGNVQIIRGTQITRIKQLAEAFTIDPDTKFVVVIAGYESVVKSWEHLQYIEWDFCALDESDLIRNPSTKRAKHMLELRDKCAKRVILSGTAMANTPLSLYMQLEFLGKGWSGFSSWDAWRKFYGVYEEDNSGRRNLVGIQNKPFLQERLSRVSMVLEKREAMPDLPPKTYDTFTAEMSEEQAEAYDSAAKSIAYEIESTLESSIEAIGKSMTMNNALTKLLRLSQITAGFLVWDKQVDFETEKIISPQHIEFFKQQPKLDALIETIKEHDETEKIIVWTCWVPTINQISARLAAEGIGNVTFYGQSTDQERLEAEEAFNCDPMYRVFVGNPASGGVGLNLLGYPYFDPNTTINTDCVRIIHYAQNWSDRIREQGEGRAAERKGARRSCRITDLVVPKTIDEEIRTRVMGKMLLSAEISDLRQILNNVLNGIGQHDDE